MHVNTFQWRGLFYGHESVSISPSAALCLQKLSNVSQEISSVRTTIIGVVSYFLQFSIVEEMLHLLSMKVQYSMKERNRHAVFFVGG